MIIRELTAANAGSARINAKERETRIWKKRKVFEAHRVKHPTPSQATDALTGEEEKNGKQKSEEREKDQGTEGETSTPSRAIDALIGEEEQKGKQKRAKRRTHGPGPQPSYLGSFGQLLQPTWVT